MKKIPYLQHVVSSRGIKVIIIPINIPNGSKYFGTKSLTMLDYEGHILFLSWQYNIFFIFLPNNIYRRNYTQKCVRF